MPMSHGRSPSTSVRPAAATAWRRTGSRTLPDAHGALEHVDVAGPVASGDLERVLAGARVAVADAEPCRSARPPRPVAPHDDDVADPGGAMPCAAEVAGARGDAHDAPRALVAH